MVFCSFMNLVAIVGFAVVKVIDTCITAKHMYDEGYIGHKYRNNPNLYLYKPLSLIYIENLLISLFYSYNQFDIFYKNPYFLFYAHFSYLIYFN